MTVTEELWRLSAFEALSGMRSGLFSSEELVRSCLERIAQKEPSVRAWAYLNADHAIAQARECDMITHKGPLCGLPIGIKDVFLTEDMPTQYNSPIYRGFFPEIDAAAVALLRQAGAVIMGKTETVEFAATGRKAPTRNPHDLARTPGGSSSGSAAAVADFHVPLALGTQTGGSMIRPASFCGTYAMKPTWNLVSTEGARRYATSLDTAGWFGRSIDDLSLLYDIFDAFGGRAEPVELKKARIGFIRTPFWAKADDSTRHAMAFARKALAGHGASIEDVELPDDFAALAHCQMTVMQAEGQSAFLPEYRIDPSGLDPSIRAQVENSQGITRQDLLGAYDLAARCRVEFDRLAGQFDAVITPSAVGEAPEGLAFTGDLIFCGLWTLLHVPTINIPGLTGSNGLPVGLTVTGPRFSDRKLLDLLRQFPVWSGHLQETRG